MPFLQFNHVVEGEFLGIISLIIDSDTIPNAIHPHREGAFESRASASSPGGDQTSGPSP